jgi:hypothetical protein
MPSDNTAKDSEALLAYVLLSRYLSAEGNRLDLGALRSLAGPGGRLGGVTATCFLLYRPREQGQTSVSEFVFRIAPLLLQQLSRSTQRERVSLKGQVRGKVDWTNTYKARLGAHADPSIYVCLRNSRIFDKPENQLFKFMLQRVKVCVERAPAYIRDWQSWSGNTDGGGESGPLHIGSYFASLSHYASVFNAHVSLREVKLPHSVGSQHTVAARAAKNTLYGRLAALYDSYKAIVEVTSGELWARVIGQTLPLPPAAAALGRTLSRSKTIYE